MEGKGAGAIPRRKRVGAGERFGLGTDGLDQHPISRIGIWASDLPRGRKKVFRIDALNNNIAFAFQALSVIG
jgi:hypothetical protein